MLQKIFENQYFTR